jgi:cyanophycin synthetase
MKAAPARAPSWNSQQVERAFVEAGAEVRRRDWLRLEVDRDVWFEVRSPRTSSAAVQTCKDKGRTTAALQAAGVPFPEARRVQPSAAPQAARALGFPVCVKPAIGSRGRAVTTEISSADLLAWAVARASKRGREPVLVERSITGTHWRVLVFGRAVSAVECRPWLLTGDGRTPIDRLVEAENRRRERAYARPFSITLDETVLRVLAEQHLHPTTVLERGETARVAWSMNARQGAILVEHGESAPARVRAAAEAAVAAVPGLAHGAVDLVDDGEIPWVVDVNSNPGLGAHLHPYEGDPQPVLDALVATHRTVAA